MKHTIIEKAALKAKSEELGIPFSNLLAGYVLEELMYLIENSQFSLFLWLKNDNVLGVEQYRKKNILTLEFAYVTDLRAMKKESVAPGQKLSLKMGYVMLASILKVEKVPEISWKGRASQKGNMVELEVTGEFEEMTVPIRIKITERTEEGISPVTGEFTPFMEPGRRIPYLKYPVEVVLAEQIFFVIKQMELIPDMHAFDEIYHILQENAVDGRHIREMLYEFCKRDSLDLDAERMQMILSYRDYSYMRKRWEKYLRQRKQREPSWEKVMDTFAEFVPRLWNSICKDEVFSGDWMPELGRFLD